MNLVIAPRHLVDRLVRRLAALSALAMVGTESQATNPETGMERARQHLVAFQRGDQILALGYRTNDRLPSELAHLIDAYLSLHAASGDPA